MDFNCPICQELPKEVVETICCGNILCNDCGIALQNCPLCRSVDFKVQKSKAMQRLVNSMPIQCKYCLKQTTFGELDNHETVCQDRPYQCALDNCTFKALKDEMLQHINSKHSDKILELVKPQEQKGHPTYQFNFEPRLNNRKLMAKFGQLQKYYCGGRLEGNCNCCNGNCGPTNGCSCSACSLLDIQMRNLPEKGYLVNKHGNISRLRNNRWSCGIGNCINNPCTACASLMNQRYQQFR